MPHPVRCPLRKLSRKEKEKKERVSLFFIRFRQLLLTWGGRLCRLHFLSFGLIRLIKSHSENSVLLKSVLGGAGAGAMLHISLLV